ncbi:outer membrane beta-barrel protein [Sanyastnella coralliicola]|uniref:outer membrane beta-barrel protein n=1 Tax=Sanyastnella coralliicola TaxID=3069118 RepID=UPI0027B8A9BE|nr:outer membrane beta-barrel protein [Longitalea sp. SCSIO 12813]
MKKLILLMCLIAFSSASFAQNESDLAGVRLGATIGTQYSFMRYPADFIVNRVQGLGSFHAGAWMKVKVVDPLYVRVEGIYSQRNTKGDYVHQFQEDDGVWYFPIDSKVKDTFFEIPIIGEYYVTPEVSGYGGIHTAVLLNSDVTVDDATMAEVADNVDLTVEDITPPDRNNVEIGYILGIQYQVEPNIAVGCRLTRMLTTAYDIDQELDTRYGMYQFYLCIELN